MKILLIGGTGLISTAITGRLVSRDDEVVHFNRGRTSGMTAVRTLVGDRSVQADFEARVRAETWDCVIDMICFQPAEAESLVRACRGRARHVILCSTVDVYARPQPSYPIQETASRAGVSAYGRAKVACEDTVLAAARAGDFAATIVRPVHTVNDCGRLHHSIGKADPRYFDRLRRGLPIVVHGDGTSLWTVCHATDAAVAFANAAANPAAFGRCYHLPGPDTFTWNDLHARAAGAIGAPPPRLVHIPTDVLQRLAPERAAITVENFQFDNSFDPFAARRDLAFAPQIPLEECVERIHRHARAEGAIQNADDDRDYDSILAAWAQQSASLPAASER